MNCERKNKWNKNEIFLSLIEVNVYYHLNEISCEMKNCLHESFFFAAAASSCVSWGFFFCIFSLSFYSASCFILMSIYVYVYSATINFPLNKQRVICKKETGEMIRRVGWWEIIDGRKKVVNDWGCSYYGKLVHK